VSALTCSGPGDLLSKADTGDTFGEKWSARLRQHENEGLMMLKASDYLIGVAAFISFLLSVYLWFTGQKDAGMFVGIWVPSIISFGIYLKCAWRPR
jgi:hypothetical protein